jgi:uncharacterized cupredoxin-like copper-binding protein
MPALCRAKTIGGDDTDLPPPEHEPDFADPTTESLERMERRLADQEKRVRGAISGFSIFAVLALVIALASLIVVATKLQGKTTTTTRVVAAAPAARAPAALPSTVGVGLHEYAIAPTSSQAKAGRVTFRVRNTGSITHEFVVIRTTKPAGSLLKGARADETGNVGETGDLQPGAAKAITLKLPAGHYALICNLPGHYAAGQHTDFTVR